MESLKIQVIENPNGYSNILALVITIILNLYYGTYNYFSKFQKVGNKLLNHFFASLNTHRFHPFQFVSAQGLLERTRL